MKSALITTALAAATLASTSHAAWQRLGPAGSRPVDVTSTTNIQGPSIVSSKGISQPENLLSDDVALSSKLGTGQSELILNVGHQFVAEIVNLVNDGAEGSLSVDLSMDKQRWNNAVKSVFTGSDRSIDAKFASTQAKYVRLQFDISKAGTVRALSVYGKDTDSDYELKEDPSSSQTINGASGLGGARVIYANPAPMGGDDLATKFGRFDFPESPDRFRTVIYDFGAERTLTEFGSVHSPRPVRFYAYSFGKDLPEKQDWRGRLSFDPAVFETMKPVATAEDARGVGYIKAKPTTKVRARYVALRWEPDFNPPPFSVSGVSMSMQGFPPGRYTGGGPYNPNNPNNNTGSNPPNDQGQGAFQGTGFGNPFGYSTGGFGTPGRGRNDNPGTPRGPVDPFATP